MIVIGSEVAKFAAERIGVEIVPPYEAIGLAEGDRVVAAVVFNHWTGADVHVSVAAERGKLHRSLIRAAGVYVFRQLNCCRATLLTESKTVLEYGRRFGATVEGLCRNQFGEGRDAYRLAFHRDDWRF